MAEGVAVQRLPDVDDEFDAENERQLRRALEQFMVEVDGRIRRISDTDTKSGFTIMPATTRWFVAGADDSEAVHTAVAVTEDTLYLAPFLPHATVTITELAIEVTSAVASTTMRIGIYDNTAPLTPNALLVETGDLDTSSTGVKSETISQEVTAGSVYWLGCAAQGGTPTIRYVSSTSNQSSLGFDTAANALAASPAAAVHAQVTLGASWTALPDPAGSVTWSTAQFPAMAAEIT